MVWMKTSVRRGFIVLGNMKNTFWLGFVAALCAFAFVSCKSVETTASEDEADPPWELKFSDGLDYMSVMNPVKYVYFHEDKDRELAEKFASEQVTKDEQLAKVIINHPDVETIRKLWQQGQSCDRTVRRNHPGCGRYRHQLYQRSPDRAYHPQ